MATTETPRANPAAPYKELRAGELAESSEEMRVQAARASETQQRGYNNSRMPAGDKVAAKHIAEARSSTAASTGTIGINGPPQFSV